MTPGDRLKQAREAAGYETSSAFAKAKEFKETIYLPYESGDRVLSFAKANEYAALLGNCSSSWLFIGRGRGPADGAIPGTIPAASGDRLILARCAAGFAAATDFINAKNIQESAYREFETGQRDLNGELATLYAAVLGNCTADWLMTGEGELPG